ncbi:SDR family oxidoreductase [Pseudomonas fakonensis]|uniref:SDR family oxidoreductase n=1 Tax=Pseudomonas fakonensis TaxID=2842355 RepID=A0ABX8NDC7_9PSED|nr:SDR family oxidoreductase [Pseudomonas fakonensis]QXH53478.1 SDR family oxidoreductase [Pseudomonas fakonensis]
MGNRLSCKTAVITGAAQGIGAAIAQRFVGEGCFVYLTDINDELGATFAASLGEQACYLHLDVRCEADWQRVTAHVLNERGSLDVLVNNAGITGFEQGMLQHDPEHARLEDWRAVHQTNLDGVFLGCKYAIGAMRPAGAGAIINLSSRSGLVGIPGAAAYASSKAAVRNHTKTVALYCAEQGLNIRCNSIHPAAILTPMWEPMLGTGPERQARMAALVRDTPLRRFGMPDEVAALAVLLASDEAAYMTGSEFNIDGGLLAGSAATPVVEGDGAS